MTNKNQVAVVSETTISAIAKKVNSLQNKGEIHFPADYSPQNALKSAWLMLQTVKDKDKNLALNVCTNESIMNSMLDMVVQGLNPVKNQCYFLVYGKSLSCQRSYFGSMAVAQRVNPNIPDDGICYAVVYEGDELKYEIRRGKKVVTGHTQEIGNVDKEKIVAAYCEIYDKEDKLLNSALMTMDQIKQSWKQSKQSPINEKGEIKATTVHGKFTEDLCFRTVINKACKPIINASSDKTLLKSVNRQNMIGAEEESQAEIEENANKDVIDILPEPEEETQEEQEPEPQEERDLKTEGGGPGY